MALARDAAGNPYLAGRATNGSLLDDILVMKLSAQDGSILWTQLIDGADHGNDRGWDIVIDASGNPVVTGVTSNADESANFTTVKLDAGDGHILWSRILPGASNNLNEPVGWLTPCDNGDVVLVSRVWTPATSYDVVLSRYAGTDGHTVWSAQYGSAGARADEPRAATRDAAGNLLIAGGTAGDYLALKYDAATGEKIWSAAFDGPAHGYDGANCVLPGPDGEVIVSGYITGQTTSWDAGTVAFSSDAGALLWAKTFDAGDGQSDEGRVLALSPLGDLYVAGYGYRLATDSDILSLRYQGESAGIPDLPPSAPGPALILRAMPNPSSGPVRLTVAAAEAETAAGPLSSLTRGVPVFGRVLIFNAQGEVVRALGTDGSGPSFPSFSWDGRDGEGRPVPAGVYWAASEGARRGGCRVIRVR